jgi:CCR4-NOT transcription complex subunit 4
MPGAKNNRTDALASAGEKTLASDVSPAPVNLSTQLSSIPLAKDNCSGCCTTSSTTKSIDITTNSIGNLSPGKAITATNEEIQNLSDELSSVDLDRNAQNEHYSVTKPSSPPPDYVSVKSKSMQSQGLEYNVDKFRDEIFTTSASNKASISDNGVCNSKEQYDLKLDCKSEVASGYVEVEDDVTSFDNQRLKDPEVVGHSYLPRSCFPRVANHNNPHPLQHGEPCTVVNSGSLATDNQVGYEPLLPGSKALCNGYSEKFDSTSSYRLHHDDRNDHIGRVISEAVNIGSGAATDKGESSIISNILSMEFDTWDESMLSPHNLAKLLSDSTENQNGSLKKSNSWNVQTNQSRFSFARQEEPKIQTFDVNPSHGANQQYVKSRSLIQDFMDTTDMSLDKIGFANGFPANNIEESENIGSGQFFASSNKLSGEY